MSCVSVASPIQELKRANLTLVLSIRKFAVSQSVPSSSPVGTSASIVFAGKSASAKNAGAVRRPSTNLLPTPPPVLPLVLDPVEEPKLFKRLLPFVAELSLPLNNTSSTISSHTLMSQIDNQPPSSLKLMNGKRHFHAIKKRSR